LKVTLNEEMDAQTCCGAACLAALGQAYATS